MNIFVVLPGNAQLTFLMGTAACQGGASSSAPPGRWIAPQSRGDNPHHSSFRQQLG